MFAWILTCLCKSVSMAAALRIWLTLPSISAFAYKAFLTKNFADLFIFMQNILQNSLNI